MKFRTKESVSSMMLTSTTVLSTQTIVDARPATLCTHSKKQPLSLNHTFATGFITRAESRRTWPNQRYLLGDTADSLLQAQVPGALAADMLLGHKAKSW